MKKQLVLAAAGALMLASAPMVMADSLREETTTEKTTTYKGTVSEVVPGSSTIVLKSDTGAPQRYQFSEKTTFVDANGNVVSRETIQNQPVTIYTSPSDPTIVSKVIVTRPGGTVTKEKTIEEREVR